MGASEEPVEVSEPEDPDANYDEFVKAAEASWEAPAEPKGDDASDRALNGDASYSSQETDFDFQSQVGEADEEPMQAEESEENSEEDSEEESEEEFEEGSEAPAPAMHWREVQPEAEPELEEVQAEGEA